MRLKFVSDMTKICSNFPSQPQNTPGLCDVMILFLSFVVSAGLLGYLLFFRTIFHFPVPETVVALLCSAQPLHI